MFDFLVDISKQAGAYLLSQLGGDLLIEHKGDIDLITHADRVSQKIIIKNIEKKFPSHAIIAEEGYNKLGKEGFAWYIDPIDGTTNFVHGVPIFCVSIALYKELSPLFGICYNPASQETFCAEKGKGSFLNGKRIQVSTTRNLIDALVATGFPYKRENMEKVMKRLFNVVSGVQGIRRFGSAALDLCYVACGRFDAYWEMGLKPWDMAAGVLILEEAGGMVTSVEGTEFDLSNGNIAASNKEIHNKFLQLLYL